MILWVVSPVDQAYDTADGFPGLLAVSVTLSPGQIEALFTVSGKTGVQEMFAVPGVV